MCKSPRLNVYRQVLREMGSRNHRGTEGRDDTVRCTVLSENMICCVICEIGVRNVCRYHQVLMERGKYISTGCSIWAKWVQQASV